MRLPARLTVNVTAVTLREGGMGAVTESLRGTDLAPAVGSAGIVARGVDTLRMSLPASLRQRTAQDYEQARRSRVSMTVGQTSIS